MNAIISSLSPRLSFLRGGTDRPARSARPARIVAATAALALLVTVGAVGLRAGPSGAASPTQDGPTASGFGGGWLARQVSADGSVHDSLDHPAAGATLATALGLAAAGVEHATFERNVAWLQANVETAIVNFNGDDDPANLGELLMIAHVAGVDPTAFGGVNLITRLGATLGQFEAGLYGHSDPTFDGAYRQSFAIMGLAAVGAAQAPAAVAWLTAQQCLGPDLAVQGGWQAYRPPATACSPPDPETFSGVDTNSTAAASEALDAIDTTPPADAVAWLDRAQNPTGGWGFVPGVPDDPNSTALVVQAIVAAGDSPSGGRWVEGTHTALSALLAFQIGCEAAAADRGAFIFPGGDGPNALASEQGVWGASLHAFPLGAVSFGATPDPCASPTSTTTTQASTQASTQAPAVPVVDAAAAQAVSAAPAFTG